MIQYLENFWNNFLIYFDSISYKLDFLSDSMYYSKIFSKFMGEKMILAVALVVFIYFAKPAEKANSFYIKILAVVGLINSFGFLNSAFYEQFYTAFDNLDNILPGFILCLMLYSTYGTCRRKGICFATACLLLIPTVKPDYIQSLMNEASFVIVLINLILMLIVSFLISGRKYFYNGWIIYFIYHLVGRALVFLNLLIESGIYNIKMDFGQVQKRMLMIYLNDMRIDFFLFAIILIVAIIFERKILNQRSFAPNPGYRPRQKMANP